MAEAAIAGSVVAVFCWLGGGSHMAGAIGISMILAFALPYFYLQGMERKNSKGSFWRRWPEVRDQGQPPVLV